MAFSEPTIVTTRGRVVRHTKITILGTLNGTTAIAYEFSNLPWGIYAGSVQGMSENNPGAGADNTSLSLRAGHTTIGASVNNDLFDYSLTNVADPDFFVPKALFSGVTVPTGANFLGDTCLPTNEIRIRAVSTNASNTTEQLTVQISLLSHILEA